MVTVYAGSHIFGGHYNPAVTLAVLLRKRIELGAAEVYMLAHVLGGITVGLVVIFVKGGLNPVVVGLSVMGVNAWGDIWIFLVANFLGGAAAGWV